MHYRTLVIIPASEAENAQEAVTRIMAPFDENLRTHDAQEKCCTDPNCEDCHGSGYLTYQHNPMAKWDWWVIGGRYCGHLGPENDAEVTDNCCYRDCPSPNQHINVFPLVELRRDWSVYNIVTPDGEWYEKETYHSDAPQGSRFVQRPDWDAFRYELASGYADHYGVCVDIHI